MMRLVRECLDFLAGRMTLPHTTRDIEFFMQRAVDSLLETDHDYIQWCFPTQQQSAHNPNSPVFDRKPFGHHLADCSRLLDVQQALANQREMASRMLTMYRRSSLWVRPVDHNRLRITRMLDSLAYVQGTDTSFRYHDIIVKAFVDKGGSPDDAVLALWEIAARGALLGEQDKWANRYIGLLRVRSLIESFMQTSVGQASTDYLSIYNLVNRTIEGYRT